MYECETCKACGYKFDLSPAEIRAVSNHIEGKSHKTSTKLQHEQAMREQHIANTIREIFGDDDIPTDVVPASHGYVHYDPSFYEHHARYLSPGNKTIYLTIKVNNVN
uniref:Uncharacterized protein n=1 Tax=Meloidogyne enterolobii TaxID=390850 RepID=A0A6V7WLV7_MELEN|nr:unnamed protein product [Meloidogyne enterolobii]